MITYVVIGSTLDGGIESGSSFRWVRFEMTPAEMAVAWSADLDVQDPSQRLSNISWFAGPSNQEGQYGVILSDQTTSQGVHQWSDEGSGNVLFEYRTHGNDLEHHWSIFDGSTSNAFFVQDRLYCFDPPSIAGVLCSGAPMFNRYGGVAIYAVCPPDFDFVDGECVPGPDTFL